MVEGVVVAYGDIAIGAKEAFAPSMQEIKSFSDAEILRQSNLKFDNYANPCELYQVPLDGSLIPFPDDISGSSMSIWSKYVSGENGEFEQPLQLVLQTDGQQFACQGFTITFDPQNGIYCTDMTIDWYRDGEVIDTCDFQPDSVEYFCQYFVTNFDKVIMTFKKINLAYNYFRLQEIKYGFGTEFEAVELRKVNIKQSINPLSTEIPINTATLTIDSKSDFEYVFQKKQPLNIYFNGNLIEKTFIKTSKRIARRMWDISAEDYVGMLENTTFHGDMYFDADAIAVLENIFTTANVPFEIDEALRGQTISGHIPYGTCRSALIQVLFVIDAVLDTSYSEVARVRKLSNEVSQTIPRRRIYQGQNFDTEETVTAVRIVEHEYEKTDEVITVYTAKKDGRGNNLLIVFPEPLYDLTITASGTILEQSANHAVINAPSKYTNLKGKKYVHDTASIINRNPVVLVNEAEKVTEISSATLVNPENSERLLEKCYNWFTGKRKTNLKIVEGKHVSGNEVITYGTVKFGQYKFGEKTPRVVEYDMGTQVGDLIIAETEYLGDRQGRITSQNFSLNGGIIIKETVME